MYVHLYLAAGKYYINNCPLPRAFCLYVEEGVSHTATRLVDYYSDVFMRVINTAQVL